jgi:hypothetical protein
MMRRAISAARKEGLRVVGIRPADGTVLVDDGERVTHSPDSPIRRQGAVDFDDIQA